VAVRRHSYVAAQELRRDRNCALRSFGGPESSRAAGAFWVCCLTVVRTTDAIGHDWPIAAAAQSSKYRTFGGLIALGGPTEDAAWCVTEPDSDPSPSVEPAEVCKDGTSCQNELNGSVRRESSLKTPHIARIRPARVFEAGRHDDLQVVVAVINHQSRGVHHGKAEAHLLRF
jgi:hypothetical protein